jgi:type II secretory pathway pseudopilin PulG
MGQEMIASSARQRRRSQAGMSLVELVFAISIVIVAALGLLPLGAIATVTTENQGHLMARCTEYAQDKLEQLLALQYGDTSADTRVFPATKIGGTGLTPGGTADPDAAPVNQYVDYLNIDGDLLNAAGGVPADWFYKRVWAITTPAANLKRVTVTAIVKRSVGGVGRIPRATVVSLKSFPF